MEDMFGTGSLDTPESYRAPESYGTPRRSLRDILGIQGPDESDEPYTATQQLAEMRRPKLTDLILPIAVLAMAAKSKGPAALGPIADYATKRRDYMSGLEEMAWKETQQQKVTDKENREKKYISTMKLPPELEQYRGVLDAATLRDMALNDLKYKAAAAAPAEETPADKDARELAEYEARKKVDQRYKDPKEAKPTLDEEVERARRLAEARAEVIGKAREKKTDADRRREIGRARGTIDQYLELGKTVPAVGGIGGSVVKAGGAVKAGFGADSDTHAMDGLGDALLSQARTVLGEKGAMSDFDSRRIARMKMSPTDTKQERAIKIKFWETARNPDNVIENLLDEYFPKIKGELKETKPQAKPVSEQEDDFDRIMREYGDGE